MPTLRFSSLSVLFIGLVACAAEDGSDTADGQSETDAMTEDMLAAMEGYESWSQTDPWTGIQTSSDGTHGSHVQIWVNDIAAGSEDTDAAYGSLIVKRGYDGETDADARDFVTAMWKVEGYDTDNGEWFWLNAGDDGSIAVAGGSSSCYGCHASGDDYRRYLTDTPGP